MQPHVETDLHRFSEFHSKGVTLEEHGRVATRSKEFTSAVLFSATSLVHDEMFEISIVSFWNHMAGTLAVGITDLPPSMCSNGVPNECYYLTGKRLEYNSIC